MKSFDEWCKWFKAIEKNPSAKVGKMTVQDFFEAKKHFADCVSCAIIVDKVADSDPNKGRPFLSEN